jgi:hypothetical protein
VSHSVFLFPQLMALLRSSYLPRKRIRKRTDLRQPTTNSQLRGSNAMQGLLYEESIGSVGFSVVSKRKMEHRKRARRPEDADVAKEAE